MRKSALDENFRLSHTMENAEDVLMQLGNLEKSPPDLVPKALEDYLLYVAKTGNTVFPWPKIKPLFKLKLEKVISEFYQSCPIDDTPQLPNVDQFKFSVIKEKIFEQLDSFTGIPFTVQRLCELMTAPKKHYRRTDKFMRGLEKNMLVVSTVEASSLSGEQASLTMNGDGAGEGPSGHKPLKNGHSLGLHHDRILHHDLAEHMSPSKRLRLSSPPPDEAGPCDSPDGAITPAVQDKPEPARSPEEAQSSSSVTPMENLNVNDDEEEMDIDAECTSSQATIQEAANADNSPREGLEDLTARDGVESSDESIAPSGNLKERTDSESTAEALSDVDASDLDLDEPENGKVEDTVSTSAEKTGDEESKSRMAEDRDGDDCSSSDDPVGEVLEGVVEEGVSQSDPARDIPNMEEMDSEAEPADSEVEKEAIDVVEGVNTSDEAGEGSKEDEEDDNVSVQSSDSLDSTARADSGDGEKEEGAADSSDQAVAAVVVDTVQEGTEDSTQDSVEESTKKEEEALAVTDQQEDGAADNPSQSTGD